MSEISSQDGYHILLSILNGAYRCRMEIVWIRDLENTMIIISFTGFNPRAAAQSFFFFFTSLWFSLMSFGGPEYRRVCPDVKLTESDYVHLTSPTPIMSWPFLFIKPHRDLNVSYLTET